jgi:hypothetical protein
VSDSVNTLGSTDVWIKSEPEIDGKGNNAVVTSSGLEYQGKSSRRAFFQVWVIACANAIQEAGLPNAHITHRCATTKMPAAIQ